MSHCDSWRDTDSGRQYVFVARVDWKLFRVVLGLDCASIHITRPNVLLCICATCLMNKNWTVWASTGMRQCCLAGGSTCSCLLCYRECQCSSCSCSNDVMPGTAWSRSVTYSVAVSVNILRSEMTVLWLMHAALLRQTNASVTVRCSGCHYENNHSGYQVLVNDGDSLTTKLLHLLRVIWKCNSGPV